MFQGADIDFADCKGHSPLLLATSCGAWRTVKLLLSHGNLQPTLYEDSPKAKEINNHNFFFFLVSGADLTVKDKTGCNFLHLAILQPRGLKNLPGDVLQVIQTHRFLNFIFITALIKMFLVSSWFFISLSHTHTSVSYEE